MDENNSENIDKEVKEEVQNPEVKEEINVEKNIEKNVENKKVSKTVETVERKGREEKKKEEENKVYVQYRKPSFFSSLLLIIIGILLATIAFLTWYLFSEKSEEDANISGQNAEENIVEDDTSTQENESVVPKELNLSLDGEFVTSLYEKIPMISSDVLDIYSTEKKAQVNISDYDKMKFVFETMRANGEYTEVSSSGIKDRLKMKDKIEFIEPYFDDVILDKYEIADVENKYKSAFGSDKTILLEDIQGTFLYNIEYNSTDNCFYARSFYQGGGPSPVYNTKIDSVEKNDDNTEVYIYDYIIFAYSPTGNKLYRTRSATTNNQYFAEETESVYTQDYMVKDEIIDKYKDQLVKYKHTFKIDETGNYYWYSTEPVS